METPAGYWRESNSLAIDVVGALNWAIAKDEALHLALKNLAGKRLRVVLPVGGTFDWEIERDGLLKEIGLQTRHSQLSSAGVDQPRRDPDVTLIVGTDLTKAIRIEGDAIAAERLGPLVKLLKERLNPWEQFWSQSPAGQLARQAAEYAVHEAGLIVGRRQAQEHEQSLRAFRESLDRQEKRIDALARG